MQETMKAMVSTGYAKVELRDVLVPKVAADEVLVRVKACGITRADLGAYEAGGTPPYPVIAGSQFCGDIAAVGSDVHNVRIGERVAPAACAGYSARWFIRKGDRIESGRINMIDPAFGGYAQYIKLKASLCRRIPEDMDEYTSTLVSPLATAVRVFRQMRPRLASTCVLMSAAPVFTVVAKAAGLAPIITIGTEDDLVAARALGADYTIPEEGAAVQKVRDILKGELPDCVVAGKAPSVQVASILGCEEEPDTGQPQDPATHTEDWEDALSLLHYGRVDLHPIYSMAVPLADLGWAYEQIRYENTISKVFVVPNLKDVYYFPGYRGPTEMEIDMRMH